MTKKNIFKIIMLIIIVLILSSLVLGKKAKQKNANSRSAMLIMGLSEKHTGIIKEHENVSEEYNYILEGDKFMKQNKPSEAIVQFKLAILKARSSSMKSFAEIKLINAYEKNREYDVAAIALKKLINQYKVPEGNIFRVPDEERLAYLECASRGEYEFAIEHAQKSLDADAKLPNRPLGGQFDYKERINDLKAAKEYILSKKKE